MDDLRRLAAVGKREQDILRADHAEVPVETLDRMEKSGGSSGADQGGNDLAPDQTGFSDPRDDHPPLAGQDGLDGPDKTFIDPVQQSLDGFGFDADDFFGVAKDLFQRMHPCFSSALILTIPKSWRTGSRCCKKGLTESEILFMMIS